jgi:hypothetical protein
VVLIRVVEPENLKTVLVPAFFLNMVPGMVPVPAPGQINLGQIDINNYVLS